MGGGSTSQSAVLSNRTDERSNAFDLQSWQGLTEVLRVGKDCLRKPGSYAEFRNLVLGYAHSGGDQAMRKQIDAIVATFSNCTPRETTETSADAQEEKEAVAHAYALGGRRMQPRFIANARFERKVEQGTPAKAPSVEPKKSTESSEKKAVPEPAVSQDTKVEKAEPVARDQSNIPPPPPASPKSLDEHKARISEIKRTVHERIGNPAALVGAHSTTGKAYMMSLLSALKATSAGSAEGVESAMRALETEFNKLINGISDTEKTPEKEKPNEPEKVVPPPVKNDVVVTPEPPRAEETKETVEPIVPADEPEALKDLPPIEHTPKESFHTKKEKREAEQAPVVHDEKSLPVKTDEKEASRDPVRQFKDSDKAIVGVLKKQVEDEKKPGMFATFQKTFLKKKEDTDAEVPKKEKPVFEKSNFIKEDFSAGYAAVKDTDEESQKADDTDDSVEHDPSLTKHAFKQLGAQPLETVHEEIGVHPKEVAIRQTELFTPEITEALDTLLHEWSIFSSSGLFGTGPGGPEHPVYQRLAPLSMGEVIAGRWEGTNSKTQKAIKEYVDAWRHEQGIAYTINETFEHYLRRVVQKILKRQKQGLGAY